MRDPARWLTPILLLALVLVSPTCVYPEPLDDDDGDDDTGDDDTGDDDTGDDDTGDDDTGTDEDGDGVSVEDGDCNDQDAEIYPGAWDDCDEKDDDCNGIVNDGTVGWDSYEPDDETPTDLGEISEDSMMLFTWAQSPGDIDRFQFFVDDNNDIVGDGFFIYAQVDTIPAGVDLSLTLNRLTDSDDEPWFMELDVSNEESYGGVEFVEHQGTWGANDDGIYELVVTAAQGYDCDDAYELYIETGS